MESRQMLSAAVSHGVLSIDGTGRADTIVLTMDSPRTLRVRVGDTESTFLKKTIGKIRINAGRGDDLVTVGSDANPVTLRVSVTGGDGSDTIVGGAGNDTLSGGAGADQLTGAGGDDRIAGDNGNDDLHGGDGRDSLTGGRGDDQLHDDAGRDAVYGNAGNDVCFYHDDAKQFRDAGKTEQNYSEPTFLVKRPESPDLILNLTPLYARDGSPITGGIVKAGGSTLVVAGNVLRQWSGNGLDVSHDYVPHFVLPGGSFVGNVSGSTYSLDKVTSSYNTYTGGLTIDNGAVGIIQKQYNLPWKTNPDGTAILPAGAVIASADGSTRTLSADETDVITGPATITLPDGSTTVVNQGVIATVTTTPADGPTLVDYEGRTLALPTAIGSSKTLQLLDPAAHPVFQVIYATGAKLAAPKGTLMISGDGVVNEINTVDPSSSGGTVTGGYIRFPTNERLDVPDSWTIFVSGQVD